MQAEQHAAGKRSQRRALGSQGPNPERSPGFHATDGLEGFPWPLTKAAAEELGVPAPNPQKVPQAREPLQEYA